MTRVLEPTPPAGTPGGSSSSSSSSSSSGLSGAARAGSGRSGRSLSRLRLRRRPSGLGAVDVPPAVPILPLWLAVLAAVGAGITLDAGFPDKDLWPLTLLGVGIVLVALVGRTWRGALLVGLVGGATFWGTHIIWLTLYLGPVPWLGLTLFEAVYFALGAILIALVYRRADRVWPGRWGRLGLVPIVIAGLWTLREGINAIFPYGGFSWARVAMSQSDSPFTSLIAWVGMAGLSFLLVWLVAFTVQLCREGRWATDALSRPARILAVVTAAVALLAVPAWSAPTSGTSRIGGVQGDSDAGLFAVHERGDILNDHVSASRFLEGQDPDIVVWPENGSDIDPTTNSLAAGTLDAVSRELGDVPLVVGTIQVRDDKVYNTSLLWQDGAATDHYDKRHPVPFAEWMPNRAFFRSLAPDLVDLVTRDYEFGTTDLTFDIDGLRAGISICFDITDDAVMRAMSAEGAQVVLAQTNNADFGQTDENLQQLAIARLRAVEFGRSVVNISTVGTSAIIGPDGQNITTIPAYEAGAMIADVPLATVATPAAVLGFQIEWLVGGLGIGGLVVALWAGRRRRA